MVSSLFDSTTLIALCKIIGINALLSGDNAVVIALSCRHLPSRQRSAAVALGTLAAILFRIVFTGMASYLFTFPYIKLAGSLLLFWIALKLLLPEPDEGGKVEDCGRLFTAVRTIVIADIVMSLDNVIGVAAVAEGSWRLLVAGLVLSMPLVIFGSTLLLKVFGRFPHLVTVGAALIAYIAGELCFSEPWLHRFVDHAFAGLEPLGPWAVAALCVVTGKLWPLRDQRDGREATGEAGRSTEPPP